MRDSETTRTGEPTRRELIRYGVVVGGGGLLAGCAGSSGPESGSTETATETPAETTATGTDSGDTGTATGTPADTSYSVTMSPVGTVEFDAVPERVVAYDDQVADYLVALGQQDRMVSLGFPDRYYMATTTSSRVSSSRPTT